MKLKKEKLDGLDCLSLTCLFSYTAQVELIWSNWPQQEGG